MTRIDSVRSATGSAKGSVLHAAEVVAPYADTAKERAALYAHEARVRLAPKVSQAAEQARVQYDAHVVPYLEQAKTRPAEGRPGRAGSGRPYPSGRTAGGRVLPAEDRTGGGREAGPVKDEAAARGIAALAALRGQVTPKEIQKLTRKHRRHAKAGKLAKALAVLGVIAGGTYAAWKWWDKQANPDWLVELPHGHRGPRRRRPDLGGRQRRPSVLDPEVQAKEAEKDAENEAANRDDRS